jgi:hypothetical protein
MSQLTELDLVRRTLETDPKLRILKEHNQVWLPHLDTPAAQTVDFIVVPRRGGLYTAAALQAFMLSLIPPGLEPSHQTEFGFSSKRVLNYGTLIFDEKIGTVTTRQTFVIDDNESKLVLLFGNGQIETNPTGAIKQDLYRRNQIWLYPDESYAQMSHDGDRTFCTRQLRNPAQPGWRRWLVSPLGIKR